MSEITVNISSFGNRWAIKNIMQPAIIPKFNIALISSYVFAGGNRWPQTLLSFGITGNRWSPLCSQGSGDVLHYSATLFAKKWYHIASFWLCCFSFSYKSFLCQIVVTPLVLLTCPKWSQWRDDEFELDLRLLFFLVRWLRFTVLYPRIRKDKTHWFQVKIQFFILISFT